MSMLAPSTSAPSASSAPPSLLQIEARFKNRIWRGDALGSSTDPIISSGFDKLDKELPGGGWPTRNLIELLLPAEGLGEIRLLSPSLEQTTRSGRNILLVSPPYIPYMHAWEHLDIDSRRIVIARVYKPAERLWVLEQGIKSTAFGTIIGWLPEVSQQTTRRLQIIARTAASLVFLFRPLSAQFEPSAAPLRILLGSGQRHTLSLYLLKRRGVPLALPIRISLPWTRSFSSSVASLPASARHHAVDRSSLPDIIA
ncbi:translesion DNA synthesis-associated protein ImuA [Nitrosovibrio sp. Nv4]|uniref:translesion DNA synthesis-associated protein ImuA n=1 Tax=Nitrosovibrio sp. Nv4 TaxID=1945880 RepID=UPI001F3DD155|nr:translesion DNA synthesis-associated protein ImuA [Nitrosovibrio sp. Nv4]